jgi:hypothetical protein
MTHYELTLRGVVLKVHSLRERMSDLGVDQLLVESHGHLYELTLLGVGEPHFLLEILALAHLFLEGKLTWLGEGNRVVGWNGVPSNKMSLIHWIRS